jgi:hypothetical protein
MHGPCPRKPHALRATPGEPLARAAGLRAPSYRSGMRSPNVDPPLVVVPCPVPPAWSSMLA